MRRSSRASKGGVPLGGPNFLDLGSVEYVVPSDVQVSLVFFVPIATGSTYTGKHKLVERDNSLPRCPAGRFRTTRWSVVLFSAQIRAEGRLGP
jgi:hypothetical protein